MKKAKERRLTDRELIDGFVHMAKNREQFPQFEELCKLIDSAYEEIKENDLDRGKIISAILAEQNVTEAEKTAQILTKAAKKGAEKAYKEMVKGKNLKGLEDLDAIMEDLKGSYKGSDAFELVRYFICRRDLSCLPG